MAAKAKKKTVKPKTKAKAKKAKPRRRPKLQAERRKRAQGGLPLRRGRMLSRTTLRAKWITSVDEHEDRAGQSLATRSHDVIEQWARERGAQPATVESSRYGNRPRVLRFDFPGFAGGSGSRLKPISWDEWFKPFDERELVFVYQEHLKSGAQSNFFRLDSPEREAA